VELTVSAREPWWRQALAPPVLAFQFLSAVPIPLGVPATPLHLGRALALFPLAGAALGLALAGADAALRLVLPLSVVSVLVVTSGTLLTGGLHLDGLMDSADGVFGGRTVARRLEIMRDSRVGSFGVLAGALQLLLKVATLAALAVDLRGPVLVVSLVSGRLAMVLAVWLLPYARPDGLGAGFKAGLRPTGVCVALALAAAAAWLALGPAGLLLLAVAAGVAAAAARWLAGRLGGGLTGDTYGALSEVAEVAVLLGALAYLGYPGRPGGA
jgi:adenosylcobinamide-GDP ribazoletransferase